MPRREDFKTTDEWVKSCLYDCPQPEGRHFISKAISELEEKVKMPKDVADVKRQTINACCQVIEDFGTNQGVYLLTAEIRSKVK